MDDKVYEDSTKIKSGKYTLEVYSFEKHWEGDDSGKMEGMPGNFLKQKVSLVNCKNPTNLEALAVEMEVCLWERDREVTSEPKGYSKLKHEQLVEEVKKSPNYYLQNLRQEVKKRL